MGVISGIPSATVQHANGVGFSALLPTLNPQWHRIDPLVSCKVISVGNRGPGMLPSLHRCVHTACVGSYSKPEPFSIGREVLDQMHPCQ